MPKIDPTANDYLHELAAIASDDVQGLKKAQESYGNSWKKRGGVGAMMMLARKWDRLEEAVKKDHWDIFIAAMQDERAEGVIDDIRDLRRYLLLVEAELKSVGVACAITDHRDNVDQKKSTVHIVNPD